MRIPVSKPTPLSIAGTYHIVYPPWWAEESEMGVIKERDFLKEENAKLKEELETKRLEMELAEAYKRIDHIVVGEEYW